MKTKSITIISALIALMGFIHIGATFSPLIGGKLTCLDGGTYNAMIYMSLMCGLLLIVLGGYVLWAKSKIAEFPKLKSTIQVASMLLLMENRESNYMLMVVAYKMYFN